MALDSSLDPLIIRGQRMPSADSSPMSSRVASLGILTNRLFVVLTLVALVAISLYFQSQIRQLDVEISSDESKINHLQEIIASQEEVIQRFDNAVTNSDVLTRLHDLENTLNYTVSELNQNLRKTEKDISVKLDNTLNQLAQTVTAAQGEIEDEVNKVKIDVEQYVRTTQDQFSMENSFMGKFIPLEIFSLFVSSRTLTTIWNVFSLPTSWYFYASEWAHFDVAHDGTFAKILTTNHTEKDSCHPLDVSNICYHFMVQSGVSSSRRLTCNYQRFL